MTSTEIALFKEMIKECLRDVIKEELKNSISEQKKTFQKDLLDIKRLVAKSIVESRKGVSSKNVKPVLEHKKIFVNDDEDEDIKETKQNRRTFEDTEEGLYRLFGGKGEFERATRGSSPLVTSENNRESSTIPVIGKNPIMNILRETAMQDMTQEDVVALKQGMAEAIQEQRVEQAYIPQPDEDVHLKNMDVPDFDFNSILNSRRK